MPFLVEYVVFIGNLMHETGVFHLNFHLDIIEVRSRCSLSCDQHTRERLLYQLSYILAWGNRYSVAPHLFEHVGEEEGDVIASTCIVEERALNVGNVLLRVDQVNAVHLPQLVQRLPYALPRHHHPAVLHVLATEHTHRWI